MNPDPNPSTPEANEARITALLLGELTPAEGVEVRRLIETDVETARFHDRLKLTIGLVKEAVAQPAATAAAATTTAATAIKLSDERRQQLLRRFKTVKQEELAAPRRRGIPWFVPMSVAAMLMALLSLAGLMSGDALSKSTTRADRVSQLYSARKLAEESRSELQLENAGRGGAMNNPANPPPAIREAERRDGMKGLTRLNRTLSPETPLAAGEVDSKTVLEATASPPSEPLKTANRTLVTMAPPLTSRYDPMPDQAPKSDEKGSAGRVVGAQGGSPPVTANDGSNQSSPLRALPVLSFLPSEYAPPQPAGPALAVLSDTSLANRARLSDDGAIPPQSEFAFGVEAGGIGGGGFGGGIAGVNEIGTPGASATALPPAFFFESKGVAGGGDRPIVLSLSDTEAPAQALGVVAQTPGLTAEALAAVTPAPPKPAMVERLLTENPFIALAPLEKKVDSDSFENIPQVVDQPPRAEVEVALKQVAAVNGREELVRLSRDQDKQNEVLGEPTTEPRQITANFDVSGVTASLGDTKAGDRLQTDAAKSKRERLYEVESLDGRVAKDRRSPGASVDALARVEKQSESAVAVHQATKPASIAVASDEPQVLRRIPVLTPQPEVSAQENAFSTFSLSVTDVSFKLAAASLEKGTMPDPATVRGEEFLNAFNYHDADPSPGVPVAFASERAQYPFAHNREIIRFAVRTAARGRESGRPLNVVLLLDNSGSMERADRVRIIREALTVLGRQLQPQDRISVVAFARTSRLWVDALPGNQAGELAERVGNLTPEGGTNLEEALNLAYATAARHFLSTGVNRVVLLTDGAANLGDVAPDSLKRKVESWRQRGVALDCFGIGWEGLNDDLLEALSRNGDGRYGFVNSLEDAATEFAAQLAGALHVAASDVKVQIEFNPQRVVAWRQIGYAKHQLTKEQFRDNSVDAAELTAAESGNALYVIQVDPNGVGPIGTARVRYREPESGIYRELEWPVPYTGGAAPLDRAPATLRLAATASSFSEWLAGSPFADEVTPDRMLSYLQGVPTAFEPDTRPQKLEWMIRQAKSISGR